jgi:hypothetical protein
VIIGRKNAKDGRGDKSRIGTFHSLPENAVGYSEYIVDDSLMIEQLGAYERQNVGMSIVINLLR